MVDGFEGLGHDAVIRSNHDDNNVRYLRAAGTHASKRFVTGGIEEDDLASEGRRIRLGDVDLVGSDVLGDAAGFARGDVG